jgi:HD superfamily phosphohydrolase
MILRDPVHGLVAFESDEASIIPALLATREVQRLRHIRQLGLASFAYPGAEHTRFAHAIGAAFVMTRFIARLRDVHDALPFWQRVTTERAREALAAALLHDVGHGPFSHLSEDALPGGPPHEEWTSRMICDDSTEIGQVLRRIDPTLPGRVAELVHGRHELRFLARAVSGLFDVDRCDYLLRDAHATGVRYGSFDLDWLLRSLRLGVTERDGESPPLAVDGPKGLPAIESFILARLFMFQQVYFHKTSRASEFMLSRILARASSLLVDGARLASTPAAIAARAVGRNPTLGEYLAMDDTVMWVAISAWRETADRVLADLSQRLIARRLFKTYQLYGEHASLGRRLELLDRARDVARKAGLDPDIYVGLDVAVDAPFDDYDEPLAVIFPDGVPRKPGDVSFILGRLRGEQIEGVRLIFAPELREAVLGVLSA